MVQRPARKEASFSLRLGIVETGRAVELRGVSGGVEEVFRGEMCMCAALPNGNI